MDQCPRKEKPDHKTCTIELSLETQMRKFFELLVLFLKENKQTNKPSLTSEKKETDGNKTFAI